MCNKDNLPHIKGYCGFFYFTYPISGYFLFLIKTPYNSTYSHAPVGRFFPKCSRTAAVLPEPEGTSSTVR